MGLLKETVRRRVTLYFKEEDADYKKILKLMERLNVAFDPVKVENISEISFFAEQGLKERLPIIKFPNGTFLVNPDERQYRKRSFDLLARDGVNLTNMTAYETGGIVHVAEVS